VVPAYNESASIGRCLTSVLESPLPSAFEWREWIVHDDGSSDETPDQVRIWSRRNRVVPMRLITGTQRQGKIAVVDRCHQDLVAGGRFEDIVVFLDADTTVEPQTMTALLSEFHDGKVAAATGLSRPNNRRIGCRGSAFQIELAGNYALAQGPDAYRIEGRFFAYRLGALADLRIAAGLIVDDTQIVDFLRDRDLRVRSAFDAVVRITPAGTYFDFYKQTYRAFRAAELAGPKFPTNIMEITPMTRRALFRTLREDPIGAIGYCAARLVAAILHRIRPLTFSDRYPLSESTKL
jgi:glycosyltransferase involved in cell wall biosynthesis